MGFFLMENSNNLADFSSLDVTLVSTPRLLIHFIGYCAVFFNEYGELKGSTANTKNSRCQNISMAK